MSIAGFTGTGFNPFGAEEKEVSVVSPIVAPEIDLGEGETEENSHDQEMKSAEIQTKQADLAMKKVNLEGAKQQVPHESDAGGIEQLNAQIDKAAGAIDQAVMGDPGDPMGQAQIDNAITGAEQEVAGAEKEQTSVALQKGGQILMASVAGSLGVAAIAAITNNPGITAGFRSITGSEDFKNAVGSIDKLGTNIDGSNAGLENRTLADKLVPNLENGQLLARADTPGMENISIGQGLV